MRINKDGSIGKGSSDAAKPDEFAALLQLVRRRIGELADQLITGDITIAPYRIRQESPCVRCNYGSICRFDPIINRYRFLEPLSRQDVIERSSKIGSSTENTESTEKRKKRKERA